MKEFKTAQEALDFSVKKIVEQGGQCLDMSNGIGCAYGNANSQHCAIGWLLDHNDWDLMRFGGPIDLAVSKFEKKIPEIIKNNLDVFKSLQIFHDADSANRRELQKELIAKMGYDTTGEHWKQWIGMGKPEREW